MFFPIHITAKSTGLYVSNIYLAKKNLLKRFVKISQLTSFCEYPSLALFIYNIAIYQSIFSSYIPASEVLGIDWKPYHQIRNSLEILSNDT